MLELDADRAMRLGACVRRARRDLGDPPQAEIALRAKLSLATYQKIESGRPGRYQPRTLDRLGDALEWQEGSVERVIEGGSPLPAGSPRPVVQEYRDADGVTRRHVVVQARGGDELRELRNRWTALWDRIEETRPTVGAVVLDVAEAALEAQLRHHGQAT